MKDSIIKGIGDSRYLKSAISETTTWEQFKAFLVAGTLPIDLSGINANGFQQLGDALNKANLLKDATAGLFGLDATAVPDDVFASLPAKINEKSKIATGTYNGTGTYGSGNPTVINFPFQPKILVMATTYTYARKINNNDEVNKVFNYQQIQEVFDARGTARIGFIETYNHFANVTPAQFSLYNERNAQWQYNLSGYQYYWAIIG